MALFFQTIIVGIMTGSIYALASTGIVLTYKTSGVLNFGYGALALFTTFIHWQFIEWGAPVWVAALITVLIVAPAIGVALDRQLFRRIEGQPMVIAVIATVGLSVLLQGLVFLIWKAETRHVPSLFPTGTVGLPGGVNVGSDQLAVFLLSGGLALGLGALLRYTRIGIALRAVVDNRTVAGMRAINAGFVSSLAWAVGTAFAALVGILLTPRILLNPTVLPPFVIAYVLGAAIVGYMRSLPWAFAGGILLGVAQAIVLQYWHVTGVGSNLYTAVPFIFIMALVLLAPRRIRLAGLGSSFIVRTREIAGQASARSRVTLGLGVFGILALVPAFAYRAISWKLAVTGGLTYAVVFLSLVILTGFSGQISIGHSAFMGIAAFSSAHFVRDLGFPVWLAFIAGALAAAPAGALIGVIAVRLHGLFLALTTLAFAFMAQQLFFTESGVSGGLAGGVLVQRPAGFQSDTAFYYLVLGAVGLCAILALNLRSGRTGRALAAMRDSETAARALGIPIVKYKVFVFGLSAFIAGLGGILLTMLIEQVSRFSFEPFNSFYLLTIAVLAGIFHVGGAITAGLLLGLYPQTLGRVDIFARLQLILFGLGATLALARNPEGMFGELRRAGAAMLRVRPPKAPAVPAPVPVSGAQE